MARLCNNSINYMLSFCNLLYSIKLYVDITTSKPSAFSINTLLIFDIQLINGALFLNAKYISFLPLLFAPVLVVVLLQQYQNHDNLIDLIVLVCTISCIGRLIMNFSLFFSHKFGYFFRYVA